ncbi:MAG: hypothetical protein JST06_01520 [Bacteroidetes bacterium]|nr:hypothetical protein [Bacteroidota bacterium]
MTSTYAILASVSLRHDYYADGRCLDFNIRPTAQTVDIIRGLSILSKMIGDSLVLLLKVDDAGKAYLNLPSELKLSFYLELINTDFLNYSNAPVASEMVCYCSNAMHTKVGNTLFLNSLVPAFSNAKAYVIGDIVTDGGSVFEALRPVSPGSHTPTDTDFWQLRAYEQYVHPKDLIQLSDGTLQLQVASASDFSIEVFGMNIQTQVFDQPVSSQTLRFPSAVNSLMLGLQNLPPAKYRVVVNGVESFVYVDPEASYARVFGIIELYNCFSSGDDFGWLTAAQIPRGLDYTIRFANRLVIWKYIARTTNVTAIENTAIPNAFEAGSLPKQFVSRKPLFMQQQPLKTIRVMSGSTILASRLANPPPDRIATTLESGNEYYCAEMYLNY